MLNHSKILVSQSVNSFEQFAEMAISWQVEFRQLSRADSQTEIFQARLGSTLLSNARLGCFVDQRGATPPGMRTFALLHPDSSTMNWFGHQVGAEHLLLFPECGDIDVLSRPGLGVSTFSLLETELSDWIEQYSEYSYQQLLGRHERVITLNNPQRSRLRQLLQAAAGTAKHATHEINSKDIQQQLLSLLCDILSNQLDQPHKTRPANTRTLKKVLDFSEAHCGEQLSVSRLCSVAQVSERSLQYLFKRELGLTPRAYLRGQRLYRAHRALWRADPGLTTVSGIASDTGFMHFGQFAATYRKQFGELPSVTLKRSTQASLE